VRRKRSIGGYRNYHNLLHSTKFFSRAKSFVAQISEFHDLSAKFKIKETKVTGRSHIFTLAMSRNLANITNSLCKSTQLYIIQVASSPSAHHERRRYEKGMERERGSSQMNGKEVKVRRRNKKREERREKSDKTLGKVRAWEKSLDEREDG
jgi:hypothetical protein